MDRATPDWDALQSVFAGDVILPGLPGDDRLLRVKESYEPGGLFRFR
jgi:hypothetical protein